MDLFIETFDVAALVDEVQLDHRAARRPRTATRSSIDCAPDLGAMQHRPDQAQAVPAQPAQQRQQVHRERRDHARRSRDRRARRPTGIRFAVARHRHRHDAGAAGPAVPGLQPGRRLDHAASSAAPGSASPSPGTSARCWAATSTVDSEPGEGSTFTITLPDRSRQAPADAETDGDAGAAGRRGRRAGTVLVIDDDARRAAICSARTLAREGYRVDHAPRRRRGARARPPARGPTRSRSTS